jgi:hypothetical protein
VKTLANLFLLFVLAAFSVSAADVTVTSKNAACNGSTDDTSAFNAAYIDVGVSGGGRVLVPSGKICKISNFQMFSYNGTYTFTYLPITLAADGGGGATLLVTSGAGVTIGGAYNGTAYFASSKAIENITIKLDSSGSTYPIGVLVYNGQKTVLRNVGVANGNNALSPIGISLQADTTNCASCFVGGTLIENPIINGYITTGLAMGGSRNANDNVTHTTIIGGSINRPWATCTNGQGSGMAGNLFGLYYSKSDSLVVTNLDIEGFYYGYYMDGLNPTLLGTRTECNQYGVYVPNTAYAYNTRVIGGNHTDGVTAVSTSSNLSMVETYLGAAPKTNFPGVRSFRFNTCTTPAGQWSTCFNTYTFTKAMTDTAYTITCSVEPVNGYPVIGGIFSKATTGFTLTLLNGYGGGASNGVANCIALRDNSLGAQ